MWGRAIVAAAALTACKAVVEPPLVPPGEASLDRVLEFPNPNHAKQSATIITERLRKLGAADYSATARDREVKVNVQGFDPSATPFLNRVISMRGRITFHQVVGDSDLLEQAWSRLSPEDRDRVILRGSTLSASARQPLVDALQKVEVSGHRLVLKPPYRGEAGFEALLVITDPELDNTALHEVRRARTGAIELVFTDDGKEAFARLTKSLHGQQLAVVADAQIWTAPMIQEPITGGLVLIERGTPFDPTEVQMWQLLLKMTPLASSPTVRK